METLAHILAWSGIICVAFIPGRAGQIVGGWLFRKGEGLHR